MIDYGSLVDSISVPPAESAWARKRINEIANANIFAAISADGREAMLVYVDPGDLRGVEEWPRADGFEVRVGPSHDAASGHLCIGLELRDLRFREVFRALAEDVCEQIASLESPRQVVQAMHQRLLKWQDFMRRNRPEGLSPEAAAGVFGELVFLNDVLLSHVPALKAVSSWRGCQHASQDYQLPGIAVEVKTTRAAIPDVISIANLQQLDSGLAAELFICLVWVHENETSGESLPGLIGNLRDRLKGEARQLLEHGLVEVGYLETQSERYGRTLYSLKELRAFHVKEGFPRLLAEMVPEGVKGVRYKVGLDACVPFRVDLDVIVGLLQESPD